VAGVNVLKMEYQQQIQLLIKLGWSDRRISRDLDLHRKTVSRYRKEFQSVPDVPTDVSSCQSENVPQVPTDSGHVLPSTKSPLLEPLREIIWKKHTSGLTAQRIYQDLVDETGFNGGYDSIKRYVHKLRGSSTKRLFFNLPIGPGEEAQVDFGKGPPVLVDGKYKSTWLFKMTLSFSGHSYEELVFKQDIETFLLCHEHAFASFGGVPAIIKLDNLKSGVLKASLYEPILNVHYKSFSEHWGFIANPCPPRKPEHKGRVERDVGYTKSNALKNRKFTSLENGNLFLKHWNKKWARTRIHGSKKCQVWKLFCDFEQAALKSLAEKRFAMFKVGKRKVDPYGNIEISGNLYPMPAEYIDQYVQVHYNSIDIKVFDNQYIITTFKTVNGKGILATTDAYPVSRHTQLLEEMEGRVCSKAMQIGSNCHKLVCQILSVPNDPMALRRCRGIVHGLPAKYPSKTVDEACKLALERRRYNYGFVNSVCESKKIMPTEPIPTLTQEHELIRSMHEYQTILEERAV